MHVSGWCEFIMDIIETIQKMFLLIHYSQKAGIVGDTKESAPLDVPAMVVFQVSLLYTLCERCSDTPIPPGHHQWHHSAPCDQHRPDFIFMDNSAPTHWGHIIFEWLLIPIENLYRGRVPRISKSWGPPFRKSGIPPSGDDKSLVNKVNIRMKGVGDSRGPWWSNIFPADIYNRLHQTPGIKLTDIFTSNKEK